MTCLESLCYNLCGQCCSIRGEYYVIMNSGRLYSLSQLLILVGDGFCGMVCLIRHDLWLQVN